MEFRLEQIEEYIKEYYLRTHAELVITKLMCERIASVIRSNESVNAVSGDVLKQNVDAFLDKEHTLQFVRDRQPNTTKVSDDVIENVKNYFAKEMPRYIPVYVCRGSNHPEDDYRYSVIGKREEEYSCWTSWNESTQSLNHGHYGMKDFADAMKVLHDNFYDISGEPERFGMELSGREVEVNEEKQQVTLRAEETRRGIRRQHR